MTEQTLSRSLVVTTALSPGDMLRERAAGFASELAAPLVDRGKRSLRTVMAEVSAERCVVVERDGLTLASIGGAVYRYHPNLGFVRALNVLRGARDLFIEAAAIKPGDRVLDCTAGFGSEALLASLAVGESGKVTALESRPELALVTREGMAHRTLSRRPLSAALRRVELVCADYGTFLQKSRPFDFDVICFDPFFSERLEGSGATVDPLFEFGDRRPLDPEAVKRAVAVAARRVIVKHPVQETLTPDLAEMRADIVTARRGRIAYSVFQGGGVDGAPDTD